MLLLSFINRRFWWPKKMKILKSRFFSFIFRYKRKRRSYFIFKDKNFLLRIVKRRFFYLFSRNWLLTRFKKYTQKSLISYRFHKYNSLRNKKVKQFPKVILKLTLNNIFLTILDDKNKNLTYYSSGSSGFIGPTKKTSFALEQMTRKVCKFLNKMKIKKIHLRILNSVFNYRIKVILDLLFQFKICVKVLTYKLKLPHNGIRQRKLKRR